MYISSATKLFSEAELFDFLQKARANNQRDGITGMLLFSSGNFILVIEGDEAAVLSLHKRILADPRHTRILTLLQRPLTKRMVAEWSMGVRNLDLPRKNCLPDLPTSWLKRVPQQPFPRTAKSCTNCC